MNKATTVEKLRYHSEKRGKIPGIVDGINYYNLIMQIASNPEHDLSKDVTFQDTFTSFYQVKFHFRGEEEKEALAKFYAIFQEYKIKKEENAEKTNEDLFLEVVNKLYCTNGKAHKSFASKILHTLYPERFAIYDSVVGHEHFGIFFETERAYLTRHPNQTDFEDMIKTKYKTYNNMVAKFLETTEGKMIVEAFNEVFQSQSINNINNLKKIDFALWIDRGENQTFPKEEIERLSE